MSANLERSIGRLEGKVDGMSVNVQNIDQSMKDLRASFDTLEAGRLTGLEISFASLKAKTQAESRNTALIFAGMISLVISIISIVIGYYLR